MIILTFITLFEVMIVRSIGYTFGVVDTLPFGMQPALQTFSDLLHTAYQVIPLLETPLELFIWAMFTMISLTTIKTALWVIQLIRG